MDALTGAAAERVDWRQVRLVLGLRWRMTVNRASRSPWMAALNVLLFAGFGVVAVAVNAALGAGVHVLARNDRPLAAAAVHLVYLLVFFMLVITPPLQLRGNEFLDVTKLFVHPVSHRTVFAATLSGLMTSGSVLFFTLPVLAVSVGFAGSAAGALAGAATGLVLVAVATAAGQLLLLAYLDTLRSRRWRDLVTWLAPLVFGGAYVWFRWTFGAGDGRGSLAGMLEWVRGWVDWTCPLPSWWAAHAVTAGTWTAWLPAAALAPVLAWLVRAAARVQERAYHGDVPGEPRSAVTGRRGVFARVASRLRDPVAAVAEKEIAILGREPAVRSLLVSQAVWAVVPLGMAAVNVVARRGEEGAGLRALAPLAACVVYPMLLAELGVLMNLLGLEGGGVLQAVLLPLRRRTMLLGKDAAHLIVFGTIDAAAAAVAVVAAYALTGAGPPAEAAGRALLGAVEGYCVVAAALAVGNVNAVISPVRLAARDRRALRQQATGREGCMRSLQGLAGVFATGLLCVPVFLLFHGADLVRAAGGTLPVSAAWFLVPGAVLAVLLCAAAMAGGAALGGAWLEAREESVAAQIGRPEE